MLMARIMQIPINIQMPIQVHMYKNKYKNTNDHRNNKNRQPYDNNNRRNNGNDNKNHTHTHTQQEQGIRRNAAGLLSRVRQEVRFRREKRPYMANTCMPESCPTREKHSVRTSCSYCA